MRLVALGASNLTLGLPTLVDLARDAWGADTRVVGALGLGRSYGQDSRFLFRGLPGILHCGLWPALERGPHEPTRAVVTDVGNDILYGCEPGQLLEWIETCVLRLQSFTRDVALTQLPLDAIRRLTPARYRLFRTLLVPSCRLSLAEARGRSDVVAAGLAALARRLSLRLVAQRPEWYGPDPVHIRRRCRSSAWREIADVPAPVAGAARGQRSPTRSFPRPERMTLFGRPIRTAQAGPVELY